MGQSDSNQRLYIHHHASHGFIDIEGENNIKIWQIWLHHQQKDTQCLDNSPFFLPCPCTGTRYRGAKTKRQRQKGQKKKKKKYKRDVDPFYRSNQSPDSKVESPPPGLWKACHDAVRAIPGMPSVRPRRCQSSQSLHPRRGTVAGQSCFQSIGW